MLSDQELIDGLQSGLATLHPRSDLIDRIRERAAAGQPRALTSRSPHRPPWLPTFSAVVATASMLLALAVGGGALVLLGGHHPPRLRTTASPLASPTHSSNGSRGNCPAPGRPRRPTSYPGTSFRPPSPSYPTPTARRHCSSQHGKG